jgi:hypothetical protein
VTSNAGRTEMKFVISRAGVQALSGDKLTEVAFGQIAKKIASTAQGYGGRFSSRPWQTETKKEAGAVVARAGTSQPAAHWDEWGNVFRAPRAPLRRALQSAGLWSKTAAK